MGFKKILPLYYVFGTQTPNQHVVTPMPVTGVNTYTQANPTYIGNEDNIGAIVQFSGTPTGTLTVNVSNDDFVFTSLTFVPPLTQPTGTPLTYGIDLNQVPWPYLQFVYSNTGGSGGLIISITAKDLN